MTDPRSPKTSRVPPDRPRSLMRSTTSYELLGGEKRIWIEHDSQRYLLQITKSNKLILTK